MPIICVSNTLGSVYYNPSGNRAKSAKFLIFGSIINLILNLIFIPKCGVYGATVASIIAELVISVLYVKFCDKTIDVKFLFKKSYKKILAGLAMILVVLFVGTVNLPNIVTLLLQIIVGIFVYLIILLLLRDKIIKYMIQLLKRGEK